MSLILVSVLMVAGLIPINAQQHDFQMPVFNTPDDDVPLDWEGRPYKLPPNGYYKVGSNRMSMADTILPVYHAPRGNLASIVKPSPDLIDQTASHIPQRICSVYPGHPFCRSPSETHWTNPIDQIPNNKKERICSVYPDHPFCRSPSETHWTNPIDQIPNNKKERICSVYPDHPFCRSPSETNRPHIIDPCFDPSSPECQGHQPHHDSGRRHRYLIPDIDSVDVLPNIQDQDVLSIQDQVVCDPLKNPDCSDKKIPPDDKDPYFDEEDEKWEFNRATGEALKEIDVEKLFGVKDPMAKSDAASRLMNSGELVDNEANKKLNQLIDELSG